MEIVALEKAVYKLLLKMAKEKRGWHGYCLLLSAVRDLEKCKPPNLTPVAGKQQKP